MMRAPAWAAQFGVNNTNKTTFDKLVAKVAPNAANVTAKNFKPRVACTCVSTVLAPGFLVTSGPDRLVGCATPAFKGDGSFNGTLELCPGDFVVLGR
jgi:hypothetical protein